MYQSYKVSNYEYCTNVEDITNPRISTMKVAIPKYMTNMEPGNWTKKVPIRESMFVNADDCKPKPIGTITEQGYYTISKYPNETLDFSSKINNRGVIPAGTQFLSEVLFEDIESIKLTGKV